MTAAVPIDLTGWRCGDESARDEVARSFDEACRTTGFVAISGHGVPASVVAAMLDVTQAFFDLPASEKARYFTDDAEGNRGYAPLGSEALAYSLGIDSAPDLFEAFNIGREYPPIDATAEQRRRYFAPNTWPRRPEGFRDVWLRYWDAMEDLGFLLLEVCARALGLPDGWFHPYVDESISVMRAVNYQRHAGAPPVEPGQLRMGSHSDYGSLTILLADPVPGLQIEGPDGGWHDVLPPEEGFLVNIGDLMAEWTNDRWLSTKHRVVPPPDDEPGEFRRRSVAWFQQPNHDALIEVLDPCTSPDRPPRYAPTTSGEHLLAKLLGPRELRASTAGAEFMRR